MSKSDFRGARIAFQFAALPQEVIRSRQWIDLPPNAVKLTMALVGQYTGKNNGRLCPSIEALSHAGYDMSKHTAITALRALQSCEWCITTRAGHPPRTATWIGFTWWRLNWEKSMDIGPREFPHLNFVKVQIGDPNHGRGPPPKTKSVVQILHHRNRAPQ